VALQLKPDTKISAIVVAYNRKNLLRRCLTAIQNQSRQVDRVVVVDNASTDGTGDMLKAEFPSTAVITLQSNTGGAGGFYIGMKKAYEEGNDLFWLMDDDAEPHPRALELLLRESLLSNDDISCMAGSVKDAGGKISLEHRGLFNDCNTIIYKKINKILPMNYYKKEFCEIDTTSFVGPLIKRSAIKKIGFPRKEFFIHHDDLEYSMRLREAGKIIFIPESIIYHHEDLSKSGSTNYLNSEYKKLWLRYYGKRNLVYIAYKIRSNNSVFIYYFARMLISEIKTSIFIALKSNFKLRRIIMQYIAIYNGLTKNFDNTVPLRMLYKQF
jgi:GT2 family glycosyltransferase